MSAVKGHEMKKELAVSEALNHLQLAEENFLAAGDKDSAKRVAKLHTAMRQRSIRIAQTKRWLNEAVDKCEASQPYCHAGKDGDCNWQDCPQEANNRANWRDVCPLARDEAEEGL